MTFQTSAKATEDALSAQGRSLATAVTAKRADKLIRGLRKVLADQQVEETGTAAPRQFGYGLAKVETTRVFREVTSDGRLHLVDAIVADEIDGVLAYLVDDAVVFPGDFPGQIRPDGNIFSGRFKDSGSQIYLKKGSPGQTSEGALVNRTSAESDFVGTGIAYVYSVWRFIEGRFDGDPAINVIARLRKPTDPRGGTARWSFNPYVHIYDILIKSRTIGGAGVDPSLIDTDSFAAGAVWADMILDVNPSTKTAIRTTRTNQSSANHLLEFEETVTPFNYGDVVNLVAKAGQTMPPNFSPGVDYHVIPIRHRFGDFQVPSIALASTLSDALDGNFIAAGTRLSDIDVKRVRETRYMSGFTYRSNEAPLVVVQKMLESCGASLYLADGKIAITRQNFPSTVATVTEDDIVGKIVLSNRLPSNERVTSFTGTFTSLLNLFEPKDYPIRDGGGVYKAADGGEEKPARLNLPFVGKAGAAQRLATIALRKNRQERTLTFAGTLALYRLQPGTVFTLDHPALGLDSNTPFEVRDQTLFIDTGGDSPIVGIDIVARQLEATTFDLDATADQLVEAAKIPGLQSPFEVGKPGAPTIVERLFNTTNGTGVKALAVLTWNEPASGFVVGYRVSYKLTSETVFRQLPQTPDTTAQIDDIAPGTYDFRIVAVNTLGATSEPTDKQQEIQALSAPPSDPVGLAGQQQNLSVILEWELSADLDVRFGGQVEIRHQSDVAGGKGGDSRLLTTLDGNITSATLPFVKGTFYVRFIDQTGNASGFSEWSTDEVRPVPFGQTIVSGAFQPNDGVIENQVTLSESPSFPSTNPGNTMVKDTINQWITLPLVGGIDSVANIDDVPNIDDIPAGNSVAPEGVWFFDQDIELLAPSRVRWEVVLETEVVDIAAGIDSIANIDDVPNIDAVGAGTAQPGQATAWMEVRYSRGTVASDTFGPWERIESRVLFHRSHQYRVQARSFLPTVNIRVKTALLIAREVPFDA